MFGTKKLRILIWSVTSSLLLTSCGSSHSSDQIKGYTLTGKTQGTTYTIIVAEDSIHFDQSEVDSLLVEFDNSLSTYKEISVISAINSADSFLEIVDKSGFFKNCYSLSKGVYELSLGDFDPSIYPLVEGWGFMHHMDSPLNQSEVDSLLKFVSFKPDSLHSISFIGDVISIQKVVPEYKLDFNAVAQGYAVDVVAEFISSKGHENFYVEIGGEIIVKGLNRERENWKIGIDAPKDSLDYREIMSVVNVTNRAVATSGNYRNYYIKDGVKYAHTLNPKTGFPVTHSLLSATVVAPNCAEADAYATVFMVKGVEETISFLNSNPDLEIDVLLYYANDDGSISSRMSEGFSKYLNN